MDIAITSISKLVDFVRDRKVMLYLYAKNIKITIVEVITAKKLFFIYIENATLVA